MIDQIILPPELGELFYSFGYNASTTNPSYGWGELNSFTLPSGAPLSGAQTSYQFWKDGQNHIYWDEVLGNFVKNKTLNYLAQYDGASAPTTETWKYDAGFAGVGGSRQFTAPDGGITKHYFINAPGNWDDSLVYKIENPDDSVIERIWQPNTPISGYPGNAYIKTEFNSVKDISGARKTAIKDYSYDKNGNVTQVAEYDWVPYSSVPRDGQGKPTGIPGGTPKRVTVNTYFNPTPNASDTTTDNPNVYHKTSSPNWKRAIDSSEVRSDFNPTTALSRTEFLYDDYSTKGNLTAQVSWDSTKGAITRPLIDSSPVNYIFVSNEYGAYGNLTTTIDPRGNQTRFIYEGISGTGTPSNLYPTKIQVAYQTPVWRTKTLSYDFNSGLVTQSTDFDNNLTTKPDYDSFGRPISVTEAYGTPNQRTSSTEYSDTERRVITRADLHTTGDGKLVSVQHYDQLGRVRLTRMLEDSSTQDPYDETQGVKVQTRYFAGDAIDLDPTYPDAYQVVSNPYRAATSSAAGSEGNGKTMGWTRTKLDKSGRVIEARTFGASLPQPWGSNATGTGVVMTEYDGEFAKVTDQANKVRRSMVDGLGRLVRVDEPDGGGSLGDKTSPAQPTSYTYDALNNLTQVNQGQGQQIRTFNYNSLSRLTLATNPESGAVTYQYDNNGNLKSKTDARMVTTTIVYDALNRPTSRSYNPATTPTINYYYDNQTLPSGAPSYSRGFARGALVAVTYGGGSAGNYYGYDELGRINIKYQRINTTNYSIQATYNKAGGMTGETYPSGRTVSYGYDNAGRLTGFSGTLGDGLSRTYATIAQYNPAGQKERESYGTGANGMTTPLYLKLHYNRRHQMVDLRLGSVNDEWNLDRGALTFYYGTVGASSQDPFYDDTDNNGNLSRQWNYVPKPGGGTVTPQLDDYSYDSLNRISGITEGQIDASGTLQSGVMTQTFAYDIFGNRKITSATGGVNSYNPTYNTANNRINGLGYDLAGNITIDPMTGGTMTYDAENRMLTATSGGSGNYVYDGEGKRVKRITAGGQDWWYVYGIGGELLAEYLASAPTTAKKEYGYRSGQLLVTADSGSTANLALGKPATQSSTDWGGVASRAVDGNTSGNWADNSVTHTVNEYQPWWQVDLGSVQQIGAVKLWNRTDCCGDRLNNFYVLVSDAPFSSTSLTAAMSQAGVSSYYVAGSVAAGTEVGVDRSGRYVRVQLAGNNPLSMAEVEVRGGQGIQWVVADHLGSTRMVIDKTGSLGGIERHDYLPFGEELTAGIRSAGGYGYAGSNVRQKFGSYERDNETGLDFAQARYFASVQGRFTSVDPLMASGRVGNPQSWNRYSYVLNRPLNLIDPSGMRDFEVNPDQHEELHQQPAQLPPPPAPTNVPLVPGPVPLLPPPTVTPVPTSVIGIQLQRPTWYENTTIPTNIGVPEGLMRLPGIAQTTFAGYFTVYLYTVLDQNGNPFIEGGTQGRIVESATDTQSNNSTLRDARQQITDKPVRTVGGQFLDMVGQGGLNLSAERGKDVVNYLKGISRGTYADSTQTFESVGAFGSRTPLRTNSIRFQRDETGRFSITVRPRAGR